MAQSVRIEFVKLGKGGNPEGVISGIAGASLTLAVSNTATGASTRPRTPADVGWDIVRLTAIGNPVYVTWGSDPTATLTNSIRLATDVPECFAMADRSLLSFIAEQA